ncbi:MAG: DNA gyrase subunit A, partial [Alphaproteobacteria bacterium]|nr:DNA gyrase subunit A [Alphaproteobacteria bacterium]
PELLNLKGVLSAFIAFREKTITRRTEYELRQARARAHILVGLAVAVANIDEIIALIRKSSDPAIAKAELIARDWPVQDVAPLVEMVDENFAAGSKTYKLSETQAKAILDLRLHRLTGLERDKIGDDLKSVVAQIADYLDILSNRPRVFQIMSDEMAAIKTKFATPRKTTIEPVEFEQDIEDLIQREDMVVTVSHAGYVKRVPLSTYRAQKRGGKGRTGMATKDEDFVSDIFVASTHTPMLFFSSLGRVYKLKVYKLPLGNPQSRGKALVNLLPLEQGETITTVLHLPEDEATWENLNVMFATSAGTVRRNQLSDFSNVRPSGIIAMKLEDGDKLIAVHTCTENDDVLLATRQGKAIRFAVTDVRVFSGRTSVGVRGVKLGKKDEVMSMSILKHVQATADERAAYLKQAKASRAAGEEEIPTAAGGDEEETTTDVTLSPERYADMAGQEEFLLTVSERGFGKRTSSYEYRISGRGGQGIWNMAMSERNGLIVATFPVTDSQEIMLVSDGGQIIRMPVGDIRIAGRQTQGVTVFRVDESEKVVSVAALNESEEDGESEDAAPNEA